MGLFDHFKKKKAVSAWDSAYQAEPHFYRTQEGNVFCSFALTEGTDTILPLHPQYTVEGKPIDDWRLVPVSTSKDSVIGAMDYFEALSKLQKYVTESREKEILVRGLSSAELESLQRPDPSMIQTAFEKNLKYISETEKEAGVIERQFARAETRFFLTVGMADCPSGRILAGDPLVNPDLFGL